MLDGEEVVHPIGSSIVQPTFIDKHTNLFIKQTRKGCYQEMLGCEAQTEFKIATMEDKNVRLVTAEIVFPHYSSQELSSSSPAFFS